MLFRSSLHQSVRRGGVVTEWNDFPYDLESYPNVFSAVIVHAEYVRVGFQIVGEVIPLCHSTTASHALVQASRSSVVVQAQISVQSLAGACNRQPPGFTYEP